MVTQAEIGQVQQLVGAALEGRKIQDQRPAELVKTLSPAVQKLFREVRDQTNSAQNAFAFGRRPGATISGGIRVQALPPSQQQQFVAGRQVIVPPTVTVQGQVFPTIPKSQLQDLPTARPSRNQLQEFLGRPDIGVEQKASVGDVLFGEAGKPFVGFDILPRITPAFIPRERDIQLQQVQTFLRAAPLDISLPRLSPLRGVTDVLPRPSEFAGLGVRIGAELIPTTPGEVGITGGLIGASILAPPIVGTGISLGVSGLGIRTVFDPGLTFEQRAAGGLVGVLGGVGAAAGVTPFIRGFGARPARIAPEGFQVIPRVRGIGDIGLIQPGRGAVDFVDLPPTSPLVRGGFGRIPGGETRFLGTEQLLATSQRGFFEIGRDIPIEREFFVTPQEPTLGIAETRISRLGLQDPFKFPESVEIGFGLPQRPQIGVTRGRVARRETAEAFELGRGTELEAIRTTGIITDIAQIGRTRIRGQGVDIFEFQVGRAPRGRARPRRAPDDFVSRDPITRVSGEPLLGTFGLRPTRGISVRTSALVSPLLTAPISPDISIPFSPPISPGISPLTSDLISLGLIPTISPPTIPTISLGILPSFEDPLRRIRIPRRRRKKEKKVTKRRRITTPTRVSFTGIVLGIEEAAFVDPRFGVSPLDIRGLATGLDVPTRRKKKKVSKKKSIKKKRKKKKK